MPKFQSPDLLELYDQACIDSLAYNQVALRQLIAYVDRLEARLAILEAQATLSQRCGPSPFGIQQNPV